MMSNALHAWCGLSLLCIMGWNTASATETLLSRLTTYKERTWCIFIASVTSEYIQTTQRDGESEMHMKVRYHVSFYTWSCAWVAMLPCNSASVNDPELSKDYVDRPWSSYNIMQYNTKGTRIAYCRRQFEVTFRGLLYIIWSTVLFDIISLIQTTTVYSVMENHQDASKESASKIKNAESKKAIEESEYSECLSTEQRDGRACDRSCRKRLKAELRLCWVTLAGVCC